jgi:fructokinase
LAVATIICWGELLWDLFPDGPRLGGGAANVAYHLAQLGNRVRLVSRVGDDALGRSAVEALTRFGVETSLVQVDRERATGSVAIELEAGEPRFTLAEQAAWDRIEYCAAVRQAIAESDALCYGTLAQRTPLGLGALQQALAEASPELIRVCDLNVRLPHTTEAAVEAALTGEPAVKLNQAEVKVIEYLFATDDAVRWLLEERGVRLVALTLGERGAELVTRSARIAHPGFSASGGDRVGAGDAFTAVVAHHLVKNTAYELIAERANRYAAFVASRPGAMPKVPDELRQSTAS